MTHPAPTDPHPTGTARKIAALTLVELRLMLRNKTVAATSVGFPLALGLLWAYTLGGIGDPVTAAVTVTLQISIVVAMGVYVGATLVVVTRRHSRVLKRMRTSGLSDPGLLVATTAPAIVLGLGQLTIFTVINGFAGLPFPVDPLPLALAVVGGLALAVLAALATTVVTATPERAQITTLPLTFVLLGAGAAVLLAPSEGPWSLLLAVPGAAVGELTGLAFVGGTWQAGPLGLPAVVLPLLALAGWSAVFGSLCRARFRWDDRSG